MMLSTAVSTEQNFPVSGAFSNVFEQNSQNQSPGGFSHNTTGIIGDRNNLQSINTTNWSGAQNDNSMYIAGLNNKENGGFEDVSMRNPMGRTYPDDNLNPYGKQNQRPIIKSQSTLNTPYESSKYLDSNKLLNLQNYMYLSSS